MVVLLLCSLAVALAAPREVFAGLVPSRPVAALRGGRVDAQLLERGRGVAVEEGLRMRVRF